jgi:predicted HicB family RNase H-like nuclease
VTRKTQQKGEQTQKMKTVLISIPEELHTAMKMAAASAKTTVKGYVTEAIRQAVEKGGERKR